MTPSWIPAKQACAQLGLLAARTTLDSQRQMVHLFIEGIVLGGWVLGRRFGNKMMVEVASLERFDKRWKAGELRVSGKCIVTEIQQAA